MKFHITATSGSEDPTKATLAFVHAMGAKQAGHDVSISLLGDSVVMLNPTIAKNIQGVGMPPLTDLINFAKENGIPVYGWGLCCTARGVGEELTKALGGTYINPKMQAEMCANADRTVYL